jgi:hypothetical protein
MKRKLSRDEVADQRRGGHRLVPGFWVDRDGALHVSVPELLALFDLPDTPDNRAAVVQLARESFQAGGYQHPEIIEQEQEKE